LEAVKDFLLRLWANDDINLTIRTALRLGLATILGGIIGSEREHSHRPAGLRTHILVCVGSALVMCTSAYIFSYYQDVFQAKSVPDPARLGAQVISGIGFLGAGTILREGFSVKGLTTAASLWTVSCIGLAVGIGFWPGALLATGAIYLTLNVVKKMPIRKPNSFVLFVGVEDAEKSSVLIKTLQNCGAKLEHLEIIPPETNQTAFLSKQSTTVLKVILFLEDKQALPYVKECLLAVEGINEIFVQ
jgi:putative Mg2+ transporter-C (MgtC) family protein